MTTTATASSRYVMIMGSRICQNSASGPSAKGPPSGTRRGPPRRRPTMSCSPRAKPATASNPSWLENEPRATATTSSRSDSV